VDQASKQAGKNLKASRRPAFKFSEMGIPIGGILASNVNDDECLVVEDRKVRFRDRVMSLTKATRFSLDNSYNVAPCPHWVYDGKNLRELYDNTYGLGDED